MRLVPTRRGGREGSSLLQVTRFDDMIGRDGTVLPIPCPCNTAEAEGFGKDEKGISSCGCVLAAGLGC